MTIANLVQEGSYNSLEALEQDVETATSELLSSLDTNELSTRQPSVEQTRLHTSILAFQKVSRTLLSREETRLSHVVTTPETSGEASDEEEEEATAKETQETQTKEDEPQGRTVLTLYGSAQGPKQLFSSLQQPVSVRPSTAEAPSTLDRSVKVTLPLRESSLPNIITTTQVFPLPEDDDAKKRKPKTFGELFGPPSHLPQLGPPKIAKPSTTRGNNTVTFAPQESLPKPSRKSSHTYATQNLSTGHWLGYGGVDMPKDPTSPTAKQKSRQRALSTGEAQQPPSEATLAAVQQAKEEALFRSAYSSFAPSRDDATAIVPEETKNKVWWQKIGGKRFNDTFPIDPELLDLDTTEKPSTNGLADEADSFKDAVEAFAPVEGDPFEEKVHSELDKDTNEVLREISELLETLASHQRIRNSSLTTNPRTPLQNPSLASLAGSPSTPSSEEIDVYQMLKSQLTLMISQLPPYAVAKLNGDQLDELNISRTIIIETEQHRGVLEEDQYSRRAAIPATAAVPSLSRAGSSGTASHTHYPPATSQYGRSTPVAHSSVRPVQAAPSYYSQPQTSTHRSPSVHYSRSSTTGQAYQTPAPSFSTSSSRPTFSTSQYGQPGHRAPYNQATPNQYYSQRPSAPASNYGGVNSQFYQHTPQSQSQRYPPQQTQNGYYQRASNPPSYNYNAAQSPHARTGSPLKAGPSAAPANYSSSRSGFGTPVSGGQMRSSYQYATPQPPASSVSASAPTGYNALGANHQQMMLDRQQAQVAAQSQARLAAQNNFNRPGSGTPQPPTPQYSGQQQPNGATMVA